MKKSVWYAILFVLIITSTTSLTGCAPKTTGVIKVNPGNSFSIAVADEYVEAKKIAYGEATQECLKQEKEVFMINEHAVPWRYSVHEFSFKCVDKNDPDMQQQPVHR